MTLTGTFSFIIRNKYRLITDTFDTESPINIRGVFVKFRLVKNYFYIFIKTNKSNINSMTIKPRYVRKEGVGKF